MALTSIDGPANYLKYKARIIHEQVQAVNGCSRFVWNATTRKAEYNPPSVVPDYAYKVMRQMEIIVKQ